VGRIDPTGPMDPPQQLRGDRGTNGADPRHRQLPPRPVLAKLAVRPLQSALASAASFAVGAMPFLVTVTVPEGILIVIVPATSLLFLALLGALSAGGASVTAGVGALFGTVV